jgi:catechol 2,3-dioxygenase-like lactoylglutathione lyase family enzyme
MNKLKQNAFWVGMGVALAILAGFFGYTVTARATMESDRRKLKGLVQQLNPSVPGDKDIEGWKGYKDALDGDFKKIVEFYEGCDKNLEKWFSGLPENPNRGAFMALYRDQIAAIEKALGEKGTQLGLREEGGANPGVPAAAVKGKHGFNWEEPQPQDFDVIVRAAPADEARVLKELQKRFWVRERAANVILGGVKVSRVVDFRFLRRLHEKLQQPEWESAPDPKAMLPANYAQSGTREVEFDLPNGLGKTMSFAFSVELPYSEVPKFVQEFLNPSAAAAAKERMLLTVNQCHVTITGQNEPEYSVTYQEGDLERKKALIEDIKKKTAARDVLLMMSCQIIDFDPTKAKGGKAADAAAPGSQPQ